MKASKEAIEAIKRFEGFRSSAYLCPSGIITIGYGHTRGVRLNMKCSETEASIFLQQDLEVCYKTLRQVHVTWTQGMWDACTSFVFNLGGSHFLNSRLRKKIEFNAEDPSIKDEFKKWVFSKGVVLKGLKVRREWEVKRYYQSF